MPPDPLIDVRSLSKSYRVHKRPPGLGAALRSVLAPEVRAGEGRRGSVVPDRRGRAGRLSRPERRREDDHAQGAGRPAPPDVGRRPRRVVRAPGSRPALPAAHHAGDGAEAAAPLGSAAVGDLRDEPRDLRHPARPGRRDGARAGRAAGDRGPRQQADPPALARRADEVRAGGGAAPPAARPVPRRADHRARRLDAGQDARLHPRLQRALRRGGAAHQPLHGRRGRALPARGGHRPRPADLRRRPAGAGAAGAARQAPHGAAVARGRARRPREAGDGRLRRRGAGRAVGAPRAPAGGGARRAGRAADRRPDDRGGAARGGDARAVRRPGQRSPGQGRAGQRRADQGPQADEAQTKEAQAKDAQEKATQAATGTRDETRAHE